MGVDPISATVEALVALGQGIAGAWNASQIGAGINTAVGATGAGINSTAGYVAPGAMTNNTLDLWKVGGQSLLNSGQDATSGQDTSYEDLLNSSSIPNYSVTPTVGASKTSDTSGDMLSSLLSGGSSGSSSTDLLLKLLKTGGDSNGLL